MTNRNARFHAALLRAAAVAVLAGITGWLVAASGPAAAQISALKSHDTTQAIDITADRLEVREKENIAVFTGSVEALQGDMQINADSVTVYYEKAADGSDPVISRLDITGHARLVSPSEKVESEWAVYDVEARLLTLGGSVVLLRGDSVLRGQRLELDLESGVTRFEGAAAPGASAPSGRVRGRFSVPDQEEEGNEDAAPEQKKD